MPSVRSPESKTFQISNITFSNSSVNISVVVLCILCSEKKRLSSCQLCFHNYLANTEHAHQTWGTKCSNVNWWWPRVLLWPLQHQLSASCPFSMKHQWNTNRLRLVLTNLKSHAVHHSLQHVSVHCQLSCNGWCICSQYKDMSIALKVACCLLTRFFDSNEHIQLHQCCVNWLPAVLY